VIKSFRSANTEKLFHREPVRQFEGFERVALRKLQQLHFASHLMDLAAPGGNRLEALKGDRKGQHSFRINDQWRICFVWRGGDAYDVQIVDYH
jgi:toxin HigB-1